MLTQQVRLRLNDYPRALSWSPRADHLAVGLSNGGIIVVDANAVRVGAQPQAHPGGVLGLEWDPSGEVLVSSGEDGSVRGWRSPAMDTLFSSNLGRRWVEHVKWSPDGRGFLTGAGPEVILWDRLGERVATMKRQGGAASGLAWRPDGEVFAVSAYGGVEVFRRGEAVPEEVLTWKAAYVSLAWSPDGKHMAAGTQENSVVYWRSPFGGGEPLQMTGYPSKPRALAWDRSSRFLATGGGEQITVWDVTGKGPEGTRPQQLEGHQMRVACLSFQPTGDVLASGGLDGEVMLWNPRTGGSGIRARSFGEPVVGLQWSADGRRLAAAGESCVVVFFG